MQFLLILAVIAAISISEAAPREAIADARLRLIMALAAMALVPLAAALISLPTAQRLRAAQRRRAELLAEFNRWQNLHVALWLAMAGVVLYVLGWPQLVRFNWGLEHSFLVDDLLILAPVIMPLVASWALFYEVDHVLETTGGASCAARGPVSRVGYLAIRVRHYLALLLVPVIGVLAVEDGARLVSPQLLESNWAVLVFVPPLVVVFVAFPLLLRAVWRTEPLPAGPLRDRLEGVASRWGFRPRQILIWKTDRTVVNAAVAGFVPQLRYVFLSDALLQRFSDDEVEAVFTHEVGHIRHRHLMQRVLVMVLPIMAWFVIKSAFPARVAEISAQLAALGLGPAEQAALLAPLGLAVFALLVFGPYSRRLELEADLFACYGAEPTGQLTERGVSRFVSALEKLATSSGGRRHFAWLHPTIHQRVEFLAGIGFESAPTTLRFERRLRNLERLLAAAVAAAAGYLLLTSAGIS